MKKGELIEGVVREVKFPNKGIVETEEGPVVVKNVIPGQRIQGRVNKKRKERRKLRSSASLRGLPWRGTFRVRLSGSAGGVPTSVCPMRSSAGSRSSK